MKRFIKFLRWAVFADISADLTEVQGAKIITFVVKELPLVRRFEISGNDGIIQRHPPPAGQVENPFDIQSGQGQ